MDESSKPEVTLNNSLATTTSAGAKHEAESVTRQRFNAWYAEHGAEWNEHRRRRYLEEPEYRERVLEANRACRRDNRKALKPDRIAVYRATVSTPKPFLWRVTPGEWVVGGEPGKDYFTIQFLAASLRVRPQTLRIWEAQGKLQPTPFRTAEGVRVYTAERVNEICADLTAQGFTPARGGPWTQRPAQIRLVTGALEERRVYKAGALAQRIGIRTTTVAVLEKRGVLPRTLIGPARVRLYTAEMIKTVEVAMETRAGRVRQTQAKAFHIEVVAGWKKLGLFGAHIVQVLECGGA